MPTLTQFEEIEAWKKARELTKAIYVITSRGAFAHDYGLRDQVRRASVSIMSNIAEGFERSGDREFKQFLALAKGSAGEVRSQLYVALDAGFLSQEDFNRLHSLAGELSRIIAGFMNYLNTVDHRGLKYKPQSQHEEY